MTVEQIVFPPRSLNKETKSIIEKISKFDGNHTIVAKGVFHTKGIVLSKHNIAYLSGLCGELTQLDDMKEQNPTGKMMNILEEKHTTTRCYIAMVNATNY